MHPIMEARYDRKTKDIWLSSLPSVSCLKTAFKMSSSDRARSQEPPRWKTLSPVFAGMAVLALVLLLLGWGLSAMQWTILTTNNNVNDAVVNGELDSHTFSYSIPQNVERDFRVGVYFVPPSSNAGIARVTSPNGTSVIGPTPVSNTTTTTEYYVFFSITNPNGSAVLVWFTGPQGNLSQTCGVSAVVACRFEPTPPGSGLGPYSMFFQAPTPGNYTIHMLSTQCVATTNCTTTNATLRLTTAFSLITYTRPYYNAGLATAIISGASIVVFIAIAGYRFVNRQRRIPSRRVGSPPPPVVD